jgi:hypothetical protein
LAFVFQVANHRYVWEQALLLGQLMHHAFHMTPCEKSKSALRTSHLWGLNHSGCGDAFHIT